MEQKNLVMDPSSQYTFKKSLKEIFFFGIDPKKVLRAFLFLVYAFLDASLACGKIFAQSNSYKPCTSNNLTDFLFSDHISRKTHSCKDSTIDLPEKNPQGEKFFFACSNPTCPEY
jgi:hypothetical protein